MTHDETPEVLTLASGVRMVVRSAKDPKSMDVMEAAKIVDRKYGTDVTGVGMAFLETVEGTPHVPIVGPSGHCAFCGKDCR